MQLRKNLFIFASMNLYTIGHSNHSLERFLQLLQSYHVDCVVDVRSVPASNYNPQFNQEALDSFLQGKGITYVFMGHEFGARRLDSLDDTGQVDFEKAVDTDSFQQGIIRMQIILNDYQHVTLMCSEANPLTCHRFALVARYYNAHGFDVNHILSDGTSVTHKSLEREMVEQYLKAKKRVLPEIDELFGSYTATQQLNDAYRLKNKEIGFRTEHEEYYD